MPARQLREMPGQAPLLIDRRPIPSMGSEQLARVTRESLHVRPVGSFSPERLGGLLNKMKGKV